MEERAKAWPRDADSVRHQGRHHRHVGIIQMNAKVRSEGKPVIWAADETRDFDVRTPAWPEGR
jgi:hypothetical protein